MTTRLSLDEHLDLLAREGDRFAELADGTDHSSPVPTCPEWTVHDLLAHQGEVHRWATDTISGQWSELSDSDRIDRVAAPLYPALAPWFRIGVQDLLAALRAAPDSLEAAVFLLNAPPPRHFWARRQANETTIHRVDALAAALGRFPTAAECAIDTAHGLDGVDEMLTGFIPRPKYRLRSEEAFTLAVEPTDADRRWVVRISSEPVEVCADTDPADATFTGTAAQLFLGLWNRGAEITATGRPGVLRQWQEQVQVQWH